jgi:hypothetical protein
VDEIGLEAPDDPVKMQEVSRVLARLYRPAGRDGPNSGADAARGVGRAPRGVANDADLVALDLVACEEEHGNDRAAARRLDDVQDAHAANVNGCSERRPGTAYS